MENSNLWDLAMRETRRPFGCRDLSAVKILLHVFCIHL